MPSASPTPGGRLSDLGHKRKCPGRAERRTASHAASVPVGNHGDAEFTTEARRPAFE